MSTVYRGSQNDTSDTRVWVVRDGRLGRLAPITWERRRGRNYVRGDNGGFRFGYMGTGPRNLATAILADALGLGVLNRIEQKAALVQDFKASHVARWPEHGAFAIDREDVVRWVQVWLAGLAEPRGAS